MAVTRVSRRLHFALVLGFGPAKYIYIYIYIYIHTYIKLYVVVGVVFSAVFHFSLCFARSTWLMV